MVMQHTHPFAKFIRILGRGKRGARSLELGEAYDAMTMILKNEVQPEQLGAFLMLIRVKEESPEEVAGFVHAIREFKGWSSNELAQTVDLDWSSYAGKRRHLPWFVLSLLALAQGGRRIFVHGSQGVSEDRLYTRSVFLTLGLPVAENLTEAIALIETQGLCYLELSDLSPELDQLMSLKSLLGLRSPVHTVARMLNPASAACQMQGIFHPGYQEIHQGAAHLLGQKSCITIKGDGGEIEVNPDAAVALYEVRDTKTFRSEWPAYFTGRRHLKEDSLEPEVLREVWTGRQNHEYGVAAIISTMAVALYLMNGKLTHAEARAMARELWEQRNKSILG